MKISSLNEENCGGMKQTKVSQLPTEINPNSTNFS